MDTSTTLGRRKLVVPENCVFVPRVVFTPTRVIFFPREVMEKNRVLRHYDKLEFVCLQIRDEDFSRLAGHSGNIDEILKKLRQILINGLKVGGRTYQFLGSSNSQLRSHSSWFVLPTLEEDANTIRKWMGEFSHIRFAQRKFSWMCFNIISCMYRFCFLLIFTFIAQLLCFCFFFVKFTCITIFTTFGSRLIIVFFHSQVNGTNI